jgi:hypothetical protein
LPAGEWTAGQRPSGEKARGLQIRLTGKAMGGGPRVAAQDAASATTGHGEAPLFEQSGRPYILHHQAGEPDGGTKRAGLALTGEQESETVIIDNERRGEAQGSAEYG